MLRAPSDIAAGAYVQHGSPVVVHVVERDGDLALVLDDCGEVPRTKYLGSLLSRQELVLAERFRSMPGERRFAFLALSELLTLTPDDGRTLPTIVNDAMERLPVAEIVNHSTLSPARRSGMLLVTSVG